MHKRPLEALMRRVDLIVFSLVEMSGGRPRRTLKEIIKRDLMIGKIPGNLVFEQVQWRDLCI